MKKVLAISLSVIAVLVVLSLGTLVLLGQNGKANKSAPTGSSLAATSTNNGRVNLCYLEFFVKGTKNSDSSVSLTLDKNSVKFVSGSYNHIVRTYHDGDGAPYLVESVDENGSVLGKYNLYLRFSVIAETISGGKWSSESVPITNTSVFSIVPYDTKITKIVIVEASSTKQVAAFPVVVQNSATATGCAK